MFTSNSAKKMSPVSSLSNGKFCSVAGISNFGHNGSTFFASSEGLGPKMVFIGKQQNSMHFKLFFEYIMWPILPYSPFCFSPPKGRHFKGQQKELQDLATLTNFNRNLLRCFMEEK